MVAPVSSGVRSAKRVRVCQALSTGAGLPVSAMNELQMGSPPPPSWARPQSQLLELSPTARLCRASGRGSQAAAATLEALRASFPLRPLASSLDCITRGRAWGALDAPPPRPVFTGSARELDFPPSPLPQSEPRAPVCPRNRLELSSGLRAGAGRAHRRPQSGAAGAGPGTGRGGQEGTSAGLQRPSVPNPSRGVAPKPGRQCPRGS